MTLAVAMIASPTIALAQARPSQPVAPESRLTTLAPRETANKNHRYAILIGIRHYLLPDWPELRFAGNDLVRMFNALLAAGFAPEQITVVTDVNQSDLEAIAGAPLRIQYRRLPVFSDRSGQSSTAAAAAADPSRAIVKDVINTVADTASAPDSDLFVYYSGHGVLAVSREENRYLALPGSTPSDADSMLGVGWVISTIANRKQLGNKTVVIDACATRSVTFDDTGAPPVWKERYNVSLFFASHMGQPSYFDYKLRSSVYTHFFAEASEQADAVGAPDGSVTMREMADYVEDRVPRFVARLLDDQGKGPSEIVASDVLSSKDSKMQEPLSMPMGRIVFRVVPRNGQGVARPVVRIPPR